VRVLGVDPGLTRCGVGVVDGIPGRTCQLIGMQVIETDPRADLAARLLFLDRALAELLEAHQPDAVAVERVFSQHNVRTVMGTAQAGAVAILAAARAGLPVQTYTPSEVKAAVTGSGQADKAQVTSMVTRLLRLGSKPRPADVADALALAICHVWRGGAQSKIASARAAATAGWAPMAPVAVAPREAAAPVPADAAYALGEAAAHLPAGPVEVASTAVECAGPVAGPPVVRAAGTRFAGTRLAGTRLAGTRFAGTAGADSSRGGAG
jgi:crossover junction endodeoxyribonuclease RuvC